jgi:HEPN superfamily RiboL-PSP-like protein
LPGKRAKCTAYAVFEKNIHRSEAFLRIFGEERARGQPTNDEKELLRGAVVFSIGALDAFLHDLVLEIVPTFGGNRTSLKPALQEIAKGDPSLALRVALAPNGVSKTDEFREALDSWLSLKSFHGPEAVIRATGYVGSDFSWTEIDKVTASKAAERLEHFTDMRHGIVHRGKSPYIRRDQAKEVVTLTKAIAKLINTKAVTFYHEGPR